MLDCIIIGGGIAGLTAQIYANRAGLDCVLVEKMFVGGQAATTYEIENYPGFVTISGPDLMQKVETHAKALGCRVIQEEVKSIKGSGSIKTVTTNNQVLEAKTIIIATGAKPRRLGIEGETQYSGFGVSYCATCDGAFYRKKVTAIIGGGNTALEDALFLARICEKVYLIHRRNEFRADKSLQQKVSTTENIEIMYDTIPLAIQGEQMVQSLVVKHTKTEQTQTIALHGVFVAVGVVPNTEPFVGMVELDAGGYIITDTKMQTSVEGIYAAGDVRNTPLRQIITAAADGAVAAFSVSQALMH